jgi:hypothetical protein
MEPTAGKLGLPGAATRPPSFQVRLRDVVRAGLGWKKAWQDLRDACRAAATAGEAPDADLRSILDGLAMQAMLEPPPAQQAALLAEAEHLRRTWGENLRKARQMRARRARQAELTAGAGGAAGHPEGVGTGLPGATPTAQLEAEIAAWLADPGQGQGQGQD